MNTSRLREEQLKLAEKVMTIDQFEQARYIAGCDQAYKDNNKIISVVVVMDSKTQKIVDRAESEQFCRTPYLSGYLFYREAPSVIEAFSKLNVKPDVLLVDANGILHPRRIGMASQLGLALDVPTIGIAKSLAFGKPREGKIELDKEIVAEEVITKEFANPLYVSPGHKVSLRTSIDIVKSLIMHPHKLPEPLHLAHRFAKKASKTKNKDESSDKEKEMDSYDGFSNMNPAS
ncbi:endonuclease V [Candidatus Woesearchaeota archaeon]|nr:endonuclease V [Candidatus Woesearchaeota archaeon]